MPRQQPAPSAADLLQHLPETLTLEETATLLRISRATAAQALVSGELPHIVAGGRLVVPTCELLLEFGLTPGGSA